MGQEEHVCRQSARSCSVGDWIRLKDQPGAIFVVEAMTQLDPPDNVEVRRVRGDASFEAGDVPGGESVELVVI
ncbi:hypothetical protein [Ottowia sp.]|uniref:hypothetical protein n=1 Tax=Ottowia sp. TaxID=1898956 RepID=UPI0025DD1A0E|nr:hypothetical protein [Ottowia sp.]MBK6616502.1 hypothetical protein [Ottowia sp.]